jgi:isoflavone/4'-methoxyisoflavone 2'-hydroxylase
MSDVFNVYFFKPCEFVQSMFYTFTIKVKMMTIENSKSLLYILISYFRRHHSLVCLSFFLRMMIKMKGVISIMCTFYNFEVIFKFCTSIIDLYLYANKMTHPPLLLYCSIAMDNILSFKIILFSILSLCFIKLLLSYVNKDDKKKLPPSPPALPFIGHLHLLKQPLHHTLIRISNRYGPATFLLFGSRRVLVISSRTLAQECLTTHDLVFANRPQFPSTMMPYLIGTSNYGPHWRNSRYIAKEFLSTQWVQATSEIRTKEIRNMVHQLSASHKISDQNLNGSNHYAGLDFRAQLFELMLNMTMMMMAGKRLSSAKVEDLEDMKQYREAIEDWFELSGATKVEDFFPLLSMLDLSGVMKKMRHASDVNEVKVQKLIEEHRRGGIEKRETVIGRMLELQQENPDNYSDFMIQNICIVSV